MACLLDTGVLLRFADKRDPLHASVFQAVQSLVNRGEPLYATVQNIAEFWNVATRPIQNNGMGLAVVEVIDLLTTAIEPICSFLYERDTLYEELKKLGDKYKFSGKQVHDARLVAVMISWYVDKILTLNERDFRRYEAEGISIVTPTSLAGS